MSTYISSPEIINSKQSPARLFLALDGVWCVADRHGVRPATALALALLAKPDYRANVHRAEVSHG